MFTKEQINEILEVCEKATEGSWVRLDAPDYAEIYASPLISTSSPLALVASADNADFITLARTVLPQLAEDYRKLLAVAEAAEKLLQERPPCPHCDGFAHPKECICEPWDLLHGALAAAGYGGEE